MWTPCKTKKERIEKIRALLRENDKAVMRGIVAIYKRQTDEEQSSEITREHNGIGFGAFDAQFMTSLAKQILSKGFLTQTQMAVGRNKIIRYARQLASIAEEREQKDIS